MIEESKVLKAAQKVFRTRLIKWWQLNQRTFPWRQTTDLYELLVAEILLRRTNATAAEKVYTDFLNAFPTSEALSKADSISIERIANKLGLFWRGKNLTELAAFFRNGGTIPTDLQRLLKLPGVGPYVARAVVVNSTRAVHVPVDSNVVRVLCRYIGITAQDSLRRNPKFQQVADSFLSDVPPRTFNYALLDFAARICTSRRPKCAVCPVASHCKSVGLFGPSTERSR